MKQVKASVSVFLALTITMMLSFCMILIESARENTMLLKADIIFHTGTQSIMAEYHKQLWEQYDLLYIDCSYGTQQPDYEKVKQHLEAYVQKNLGKENGDWLGLQYKGAVITDTLLATDLQGSAFCTQAAESAKTSSGISYIEKIMEYFEQLQDYQEIEAELSEDRARVSSEIEAVNGSKVEVKEAVWGVDEWGERILLEEAEYKVIELENPLDNILSANILLNHVLGENAEVSDTKAEVSGLPSVRRLAVGTAKKEVTEYGLKDKIYLCKYILEHFQSYMEQQESDGVLRCECEYLIAGKSSDAQNMEAVMGRLLAIREVDNYLRILQSEARKAEAHAIASVAAAASVPAIEPVIYQAMLLYWAYEDSVQDLQSLLHGEKIPLVKSVEALAEFCLDYEEYLIILILLEDMEKLSMRSLDIIEMSIRNEQEFFRIDGCISHAAIEGSFEDIYGKNYTVDANIQY